MLVNLIASLVDLVLYRRENGGNITISYLDALDIAVRAALELVYKVYKHPLRTALPHSMKDYGWNRAVFIGT
jgi:hypothetical protein